MEALTDIAIVLLARDRFGTAQTSLQMVLEAVDQSASKVSVYIADSGYAGDLIEELKNTARAFNVAASFINVGKFSNTNHAWNVIVGQIVEKNILCLENDVNLSRDCLSLFLPIIASGDYDIAVPVV